MVLDDDCWCGVGGCVRVRGRLTLIFNCFESLIDVVWNTSCMQVGGGERRREVKSKRKEDER